MSILEVKNLTIQFGGLRAVDDFNLSLEKGELVAVIGPNGAGKTTIFNMLTGIYRPTAGSIELEGESLVGLKPYQFAQRGITRTFQMRPSRTTSRWPPRCTARTTWPAACSARGRWSSTNGSSTRRS